MPFGNITDSDIDAAFDVAFRATRRKGRSLDAEMGVPSDADIEAAFQAAAQSLGASEAVSAPPQPAPQPQAEPGYSDVVGVPRRPVLGVRVPIRPEGRFLSPGQSSPEVPEPERTMRYPDGRKVVEYPTGQRETRYPSGTVGIWRDVVPESEITGEGWRRYIQGEKATGGTGAYAEAVRYFAGPMFEGFTAIPRIVLGLPVKAAVAAGVPGAKTVKEGLELIKSAGAETPSVFVEGPAAALSSPQWYASLIGDILGWHLGGAQAARAAEGVLGAAPVGSGVIARILTRHGGRSALRAAFKGAGRRLIPFAAVTGAMGGLDAAAQDNATIGDVLAATGRGVAGGIFLGALFEGLGGAGRLWEGKRLAAAMQRIARKKAVVNGALDFSERVLDPMVKAGQTLDDLAARVRQAGDTPGVRRFVAGLESFKARGGTLQDLAANFRDAVQRAASGMTGGKTVPAGARFYGGVPVPAAAEEFLNRVAKFMPDAYLKAERVAPLLEQYGGDVLRAAAAAGIERVTARRLASVMGATHPEAAQGEVSAEKAQVSGGAVEGVAAEARAAEPVPTDADIEAAERAAIEADYAGTGAGAPPEAPPAPPEVPETPKPPKKPRIPKRVMRVVTPKVARKVLDRIPPDSPESVYANAYSGYVSAQRVAERYEKAPVNQKAKMALKAGTLGTAEEYALEFFAEGGKVAREQDTGDLGELAREGNFPAAWVAPAGRGGEHFDDLLQQAFSSMQYEGGVRSFGKYDNQPQEFFYDLYEALQSGQFIPEIGDLPRGEEALSIATDAVHPEDIPKLDHLVEVAEGVRSAERRVETAAAMRERVGKVVREVKATGTGEWRGSKRARANPAEKPVREALKEHGRGVAKVERAKTGEKVMLEQVKREQAVKAQKQKGAEKVLAEKAKKKVAVTREKAKAKMRVAGVREKFKRIIAEKEANIVEAVDYVRAHLPADLRGRFVTRGLARATTPRRVQRIMAVADKLLDELERRQYAARAVEALRKLAKVRRKLPHPYDELAQTLLDNYQRSAVSERKLRRLESMKDYAERLGEKAAWEIPPAQLAQLERLSKTPISKMDVNEVRDLAELAERILEHGDAKAHKLAVRRGKALARVAEEAKKQIVERYKPRALRRAFFKVFGKNPGWVRMLLGRGATTNDVALEDAAPVLHEQFVLKVRDAEMEQARLWADGHDDIERAVAKLGKGMRLDSVKMVNWMKKKVTLKTPGATQGGKPVASITVPQSQHLYFVMLPYDPDRFWAVAKRGMVLKAGEAPVRFPVEVLRKIAQDAPQNIKDAAEAFVKDVFNNAERGKLAAEERYAVTGLRMDLIENHVPSRTERELKMPRTLQSAQDLRAWLATDSGLFKARDPKAKAPLQLLDAIQLAMHFTETQATVASGLVRLGADNLAILEQLGDTIKKTHGEREIGFLLDHVLACAGARAPGGKSWLTQKARAGIRNVTSAVVGANPSTIMKQLLSWPLAFVHYGVKDVLKGLLIFGKKMVKYKGSVRAYARAELRQHNPILYRRAVMSNLAKLFSADAPSAGATRGWRTLVQRWGSLPLKFFDMLGLGGIWETAVLTGKRAARNMAEIARGYNRHVHPYVAPTTTPTGHTPVVNEGRKQIAWRLLTWFHNFRTVVYNVVVKGALRVSREPKNPEAWRDLARRLAAVATVSWLMMKVGEKFGAFYGGPNKKPRSKAGDWAESVASLPYGTGKIVGAVRWGGERRFEHPLLVPPYHLAKSAADFYKMAERSMLGTPKGGLTPGELGLRGIDDAFKFSVTAWGIPGLLPLRRAVEAGVKWSKGAKVPAGAISLTHKTIRPERAKRIVKLARERGLTEDDVEAYLYDVLSDRRKRGAARRAALRRFRRNWRRYGG